MNAHDVHMIAEGSIELLRYVIVIAVAVGCIRDTIPRLPLEWMIARYGVVALGVMACVSLLAERLM